MDFPVWPASLNQENRSWQWGGFHSLIELFQAFISENYPILADICPFFGGTIIPLSSYSRIMLNKTAFAHHKIRNKWETPFKNAPNLLRFSHFLHRPWSCSSLF
jgi:hypothetical protein